MEWPIKLYYVYYLPHALQSRGKVGMTGNCLRDRIIENRKSGMDVTGWMLLYATYDFHDALRTELEWQIHLGCVETRRSAYVIKQEPQYDHPVYNRSNRKRRVCLTNVITTDQQCFDTIKECEIFLGITPGKGILTAGSRNISKWGRLKDLKIDIY
jgi:hypothetical protein